MRASLGGAAYRLFLMKLGELGDSGVRAQRGPPPMPEMKNRLPSANEAGGEKRGVNNLTYRVSRSSFHTTSVMNMKNPEIVDLALNAQYEEKNAERKKGTGKGYGTSGIEFLPEAVLYFLNHVTTGNISVLQDRPATILDFGCGHSSLAVGLSHVLYPTLDAMRNGSLKHNDIRSLFGSVASQLLEVMQRKYDLQDPKILESARQSKIVSISLYDPAVPELSELPESIFDYVVCTDVLEHIQDERREGFETTVLQAVVRKIDSLSKTFYVNASCRLARNVMPDGRNAHCTVKTADEWTAYLTRECTAPVHPVFSRDLTSCSFVKGGVLVPAHDIAYELIDIFGGIDLLNFSAGGAVPADQRERVAALQSHQQGVIAAMVAYWLKQDSTATQRPAFNQLVKSMLRNYHPGA